MLQNNKEKKYNSILEIQLMILLLFFTIDSNHNKLNFNKWEIYTVWEPGKMLLIKTGRNLWISKDTNLKESKNWKWNPPFFSRSSKQEWTTWKAKVRTPVSILHLRTRKNSFQFWTVLKQVPEKRAAWAENCLPLKCTTSRITRFPLFCQQWFWHSKINQ